MILTEPRWKSYIVQTIKPMFTPEQCQMIINAGRSEPRKTGSVGSKDGLKGGVIDTKTRTSQISWIPFSKSLLSRFTSLAYIIVGKYAALIILMVCLQTTLLKIFYCHVLRVQLDV